MIKNMSKKRKNVSSTNLEERSSKSAQFEILNLLQNMADKQEKFVESIETFEGYMDGTIKTLQLSITTKTNELELLDDQFKKTLKDGQIKTDQLLAEYKRSAALDLLKLTDEVSIPSAELTKLRATLEDLKADRTAEIEALKKEERAHAQKEKHSALAMSSLEHQKDIAVLSASLTQLEREIVTLKSTIDNQRIELSEQRKLTKDVAEAGKSAPTYVTSESNRR